MKKIILFCMVAGFVLSIYAQRQEIPTDVLKNKIEVGGSFGYIMHTTEEENGTTDFMIPYAKYTLETDQLEKNRFLLTGEFGVNLNKTSYEEDLQNMDQFETNFYLSIDPQIRLYIPQESIDRLLKSQKNETDDFWETGQWSDESEKEMKNKWFTSFGLPIYYSSVTPQNEDEEAYDEMTVDLTLHFGYDDKAVDIRKFSPWSKFESGLFVYGLMEYRITDNIRGESMDDTPISIGIAGDYAYDTQKFVSNSMLRGFTSLKYQLVDKASRVLPKNDNFSGYYTGKSFDMNWGLEFAKDFNDRINLVSSVGYTSVQLLDTPEGHSQNYLDLSAKLNYYPLPELRVWGGLDWTGHLPEVIDYVPDFDFSFGAIYTFDFLNMKKSSSDDFFDF